MNKVWDQQDNPAFGVRAHHLTHLMELERGRLNVDKLALNMVRRVDYGLEDATDFSILEDGVRLGDNTNPEWRRAYQTDILGVEKKHAPFFACSVRQMLQRYVTLQEDDPVVIGSRVLDGICNGTALARHCNNFSDSFDSVDQGGLRVFTYVANDLGLNERLTADGSTITTDGHVLKSVVGRLQKGSTDLPSAIFCLDERGNPYNDRPVDEDLWPHLSI